jgi:hypothetical protein
LRSRRNLGNLIDSIVQLVTARPGIEYKEGQNLDFGSKRLLIDALGNRRLRKRRLRKRRLKKRRLKKRRLRKKRPRKRRLRKRRLRKKRLRKRRHRHNRPGRRTYRTYRQSKSMNRP